MFPELTPADDEPGPHRLTVFGHAGAFEALVGAARRGEARQAYLLVGPPAVGKRTLALAFAQALFCAASDAQKRPCGHCRACRLTAERIHPDLHLVDPPLRIEAVRTLQHDLALSPVEAGARVAVLSEFEMASPGAANCLLKTLEEPPGHAVLVLTSAQPAALLPTIRSRCQVVPLRPMPVHSLAEALEADWGLPAEQAALLSRLSAGRLGWALRAKADASLLDERARWLESLAEVLDADTVGRIELAGRLAGAGSALASGLAVWGSWWRDLLLVAFGVASPVVNRDRLPDLEAARGRYELGAVVRAIRAIEDARSRLAANTSAQLTLEVLCLELGR